MVLSCVCVLRDMQICKHPVAELHPVRPEVKLSNVVPTSQQTHPVYITKTNQCMLFVKTWHLEDVTTVGRVQIVLVLNRWYI